MVDEVQYDLVFTVSPTSSLNSAPQSHWHFPMSSNTAQPFTTAVSCLWIHHKSPTSQIVLISTQSSDLGSGATFSESISLASIMYSHKTTVAFITYHCFNLRLIHGIIWSISVFISRKYLFPLNVPVLSTVPGIRLAQNTYLLKAQCFQYMLPSHSQSYLLTICLDLQAVDFCLNALWVQREATLIRPGRRGGDIPQVQSPLKHIPRRFSESHQWPAGTLAGAVEAVFGVINSKQVPLARDLGPLHLHQEAFLLRLAGQVDIRAG